jgi:hypothetical protein
VPAPFSRHALWFIMDTVVVSMGSLPLVNRLALVGWTVVVVANDSRSMVVGVVSDIVVLVSDNSSRDVVVMVVMDMSMFTISLAHGIGFICVPPAPVTRLTTSIIGLFVKSGMTNTPGFWTIEN